MHRTVLTLTLLLTTFAVCLTQPQMKTETIPLSEVSGAVNIGHDRILLIKDEGYQIQVVASAAATFKSGEPKTFLENMKPAFAGMEGGKGILDDIEDSAWDDKRQTAFVITSHSRSKKQDDVADPKADKPQRHKLARIFLGIGNIPTAREIDVLGEGLKKFPFVREAMKRPHQKGGNTGTLNIEGLAFDDKSGSLLIGLRSPTQVRNGKACAVVLTLKNPHELFDKPSASPTFDPQPIYLDLGGLGIRGMTCDAKGKGCWIVAGRSDDPDAPTDEVLSSLWLWDRSKPNKRPQKMKTDLLKLDGFNLEGVCLLSRDGKPGLLLISDDGGGSNLSRYLWMPIHEASGSI